MFYNIYMWPTTEACFSDLAFIVKKSIERAGYKCEMYGVVRRDCCNIVFGANACSHLPSKDPLPADSIIVQFEQLYDESPFVTPAYMDLLKQFEVWDYNESNRTWLKEKLGIDVKLLKIGFESEFELPINPDLEKDVDVLFYGALNDRRKLIRDGLQTRLPDKNIVFRDNNLWASERNSLISRAKCVLNIHLYDAKLFEFPRVSFLLNSGAFVISETSTNDSEYINLRNGIVICEYDEIVDKVVEMLGDSARRQRISDTGYDIFRREVSSVPLEPSESEDPVRDSYKFRLYRKIMIYNEEFGDLLDLIYDTAKQCSTWCDFSSYDTYLSIWPLLKACVKVRDKNCAEENTQTLSLLRADVPPNEVFEFARALSVELDLLDDPEDVKEFDCVVFSGITTETIELWAPKVKKFCIVFSPNPTPLILAGFTRNSYGAFVVFERLS